MGFGKTLQLTRDGDILFEKDEESGAKRLKMVSGKQAAAQALYVRLKTRQGDSPLHPGMGLPIQDIVGTPDLQVVKSFIRREVERDPRVLSVRDVQILRRASERRDRILRINLDVRLEGGESIQERVDLRA